MRLILVTSASLGGCPLWRRYHLPAVGSGTSSGASSWMRSGRSFSSSPGAHSRRGGPIRGAWSRGVVGGADVDDVVHLQHVRQQPGHVGALGDLGEGVAGWFELGDVHVVVLVSACSLIGAFGSYAAGCGLRRVLGHLRAPHGGHRVARGGQGGAYRNPVIRGDMSGVPSRPPCWRGGTPRRHQVFAERPASQPAGCRRGRGAGGSSAGRGDIRGPGPLPPFCPFRD